MLMVAVFAIDSFSKKDIDASLLYMFALFTDLWVIRAVVDYLKCSTGG